MAGDKAISVGVQRIAAAAVLALAAACLTACGSISEQTAVNAFIDPGKFDIYTCSDIETRMQIMRLRQTDLEQLMARASQGPGGEFAGSIAYRSEYIQVRGELRQMAKAKADKQCAIDSQFSSGRALF